MTDFSERYTQIFANISTMIGTEGSVNMYRPDAGEVVVIVSTMKYSADRPLCVDSYFNRVRNFVGGDGKTKLTAECDPRDGGKIIVKITASVGA